MIVGRWRLHSRLIKSRPYLVEARPLVLYHVFWLEASRAYLALVGTRRIRRCLQYPREDLIAGSCLPKHPQSTHRHRSVQAAWVHYLDAVVVHVHLHLRTQPFRGIVAMHEGVCQRLAHSNFRVLLRVGAERTFDARRYAHVAAHMIERLVDKIRDGPFDEARIDESLPFRR